MEDNRRLVLSTTVSDADAVGADTDNSQMINTSTDLDVENTAIPDVSLPTDGAVADYHDSPDAEGDILLLPVTIDIVDGMDAALPLDTRLASIHWTHTAVDGRLDPQFAMASNIRQMYSYLTLVDMYGRGQPGVHHLLKEGGSGFITYENGNRILII